MLSPASSPAVLVGLVNILLDGVLHRRLLLRNLTDDLGIDLFPIQVHTLPDLVR